MKLNRFRLFVLVLSTTLITAITPAQSGYDRLNAPTADGSPTLKVTSDWLAKTLKDYADRNRDGSTRIAGWLYEYFNNVHIDNNCVLSYTDTESAFHSNLLGPGGKNKLSKVTHYYVPLGAVSSVSASSSSYPPPYHNKDWQPESNTHRNNRYGKWKIIG